MFTIIVILGVAAADFAGIKMINDGLAPFTGGVSHCSGTVIGIRDNGEKTTFKVNIASIDGQKTAGRTVAAISMYCSPQRPWELWNARVSFKTELTEPAPARNPNCFDYRKYLLSEGVTAIGTASVFEETEAAGDPLGILQCKLLECKYRFAASLHGSSRGVIMGLLFGDTSFLDADVYQQFRDNGTAHVLAVSGLHIGILYACFKKITGKRQSAASMAATVGLLLLYAFLSMWSVSVVRAAFMIILSSVADYCDRRYDMLTALGLAALIMIVINPYCIFGVSFQMSFLAVVSIAFLLKRIPPCVPDSIAIVLAVNIGLMPYQMYMFNNLSLSSFMANIPIVYAASIMVPLAFMQFAVYTIFGAAGILGLLTDSMSNLITRLNSALTFGGSGVLNAVSINAGILVFICACGFFAVSETCEVMFLRKQFKRMLSLILLIAVISSAIGICSYEPISGDDIVFVDVGQGDCIHIRAGETKILVDGGGSQNYNVGKNILKPYLLKNGVSKVNLALATHTHTDHYKGLCELREEGLAGTIKSGLIAGDVLNPCQDIKIETLWPLETGEGMQDENRNCSVFILHFKGFKILVTGDLDEEGEKNMLRYYYGQGKLEADILKVGHHGSKYSTSDNFLAAVKPRYAVVQVGKNNYGHPDLKIVEKCQQKGIIVLRNDVNGAVGFSLSGIEIKHHVMIGARR